MCDLRNSRACARIWRSECAEKLSKHYVLSVRIVCGYAMSACRLPFHHICSVEHMGDRLHGLGEIILGQMLAKAAGCAIK